MLNDFLFLITKVTGLNSKTLSHIKNKIDMTNHSFPTPEALSLRIVNFVYRCLTGDISVTNALLPHTTPQGFRLHELSFETYLCLFTSIYFWIRLYVSNVQYKLCLYALC